MILDEQSLHNVLTLKFHGGVVKRYKRRLWTVFYLW